MKVREGDVVKILSGKDRGKRGKVIRALPSEGQIIVEGANLKKKHRRARRQDRKGEVVLIPGPISVSAAQLVCPSCGKPTRVGYRCGEVGKKTRWCKKCAAAL